MSLPDDLQRTADVRVDEPMARHTTFGIGGPADYFVTARDEEALLRLVQSARRAQAPVFLLGSGSNILVGDAGIRGVVLENKANAVAEPERHGDIVRLRGHAGAPLARLARWTARNGLLGLEWAAGIPGTLGGAVVYNAGAYGGCLADVLTSIRVLERDGSERSLDARDLGLAYRSSDFTRGLLAGRVILDLTFTLQLGESAVALAKVEELERKRKTSTPRGRNAGSVFKNPDQHPAWWLIDKVGLRGHRIGDAQISDKHTNYFLNLADAQARDVAALMDLAQRRVRETFGLELEAEVAFVGEGLS